MTLSLDTKIRNLCNTHEFQNLSSDEQFRLLSILRRYPIFMSEQFGILHAHFAKNTTERLQLSLRRYIIGCML